MFQFSPLAPLRVMGYWAHRVAPFGYLRIKAWSAAPRSFSQLSHVLHRLLVPRHPPKALSSLTQFGSSLACLSTSQFQNSRSEHSPICLQLPVDSSRTARTLVRSLSVSLPIIRFSKCRVRALGLDQPPRTGADLARTPRHGQRLCSSTMRFLPTPCIRYTFHLSCRSWTQRSLVCKLTTTPMARLRNEAQ